MNSSGKEFSHVDAEGAARMVDVSAKPESLRVASARGCVKMQPETLRRILEGGHSKGDVFGAARIAGIMAAKRTWDLIPLCHPLPVDSVKIDLSADRESSLVQVEATVRVRGSTGVEMEALTAVTVAALTIYDMCKSVDRGMRIADIRLLRKSGGRTGTFEAE